MKNQYTTPELLKLVPDFKSNITEIKGVKIHYVQGGKGQPLILIPGYPETWWAYHKMMPLLAKTHQVIVVEMRGMGDSDKPAKGYDKKNLATDVYELINHLNLKKISIVGHDIGAHVAYSFAANFPESTENLILLDTPHPDESMYNLPMLPIPGADYLYPWWLAFNQVKELPEQLLEGRMDIMINWLFEKLTINKKAVTEFDKAVYSFAYNTKEAIKSSNLWYQAFPKDIQDMKTYETLLMRVLAIGGSGYELLSTSLPNTTADLRLAKIENCGHFLLLEQPEETAKHMLKFLVP